MRTAVVMLGVMAAGESAAAQSGQRDWLQYATPADAGFDAARLERARTYADSVRSGAVMAIYRGHVVAAWGDVARDFELHSVRKSLVSALYGTAVASGRIQLDRTLGELGIEENQALTEQEKRARVRDIIAARSGVYLPAAYAGADQDRERPERGSHQPGAHFFYNNWDFNIAGVIYEQLTGEDLFESFARRIARPLGMQDYDADADGYRVLEPGRSKHPAHTFRMSTRDLARFGLLYLQDGRWNGQQIVPAEWIRESTRPHTDFGNGRGYALMWWTYAAGSLGRSYPGLDHHDVYAGIGTGGQFVLVVPGAQLVVVHRGDTDNGREVSGRDAWAIAEMILAAKQGEPPASPRLSPLESAPLTSQAPAPVPPNYVRIEPALMREYAGEYEMAPGMTARVFIVNERLFMSVPGQGEAELLALSTSEFTIKPVAGVRVLFERSADGQVSGFSGRIGPQPIRGRRAR